MRIRFYLAIPFFFPAVASVGSQKPPGIRLIAIDAGRRALCGIDSSGAVYCTSYISEDPPHYKQVRLPRGARASAISLGADHACALMRDGRTYCWGNGVYGQLGSGSRADSEVPVQVRAPERFKYLSAGAAHTCAVGVSEALYCWGGNWHGQLGTGQDTGSAAPVLVDSGTSYSDISAGGIHTCGVTRQTVKCWGDQRSGRLGLGYRPAREVMTPHVIASRGKFTHVSAGNWHTCGLLSTGRVLCWGGAESGAGADTIGRPYDVGVEGIKQLTAGPRHTCALDVSAAVWCWGANANGEVDSGRAGQQEIPVKVQLADRIRSIAVGGDDFGGISCALSERGAAICWGSKPKPTKTS